MMSAVERIAELAQRQRITIATAESLTSGSLSAELGKGENASEWFTGGIVAYLSRVKFDLLGVDEGAVITARCAEQMAEGVRKLLRADAAVAVTGAGGPDPEEGEPPGTVFVATSVQGRLHAERHHFEGDPDAVVAQTVDSALHQLLRECSNPPPEATSGPDGTASSTADPDK